MSLITTPERTSLESFIAVKKNISICPRIAVFQARVGMIIKHYKTNAQARFTFHSVTLGAYMDALVGYTVDIGTTPGADDVGRVRIREATTSNEIHIGLVSPGAVPIETGHYITVREERLIWQRVPLGYTENTVSVMRKDYNIYYSDQNEAFYPKANIFADPSGWEDPGQTYRTVLFDGTDSAYFSPEVPTFTWDIADGTLLGGYTLNDGIIEATFPSSRLFRYISLTITRPGGPSDTMYFPVWVHSAANPPFVNFKITSDITDIGRDMAFTAIGNPDTVDEDIIPRKTLINYWEEPEFADDSNVPEEYISQCMGWIPRGVTTSQARSSTYNFELWSPATWLDNIGGYGETLKYIADGDSTSEWDEYVELNGYKMIDFILRWNTTALEVCSLFMDNNNYHIPNKSATTGSITSQCQSIAEGERMAYFRSYDRADIHVFRIEPFMEIVGERSYSVSKIQIEARHLTNEPGIDLPEESIITVGSVVAEGHNIGNGKEKKVAAVAPGKTSSSGVTADSAPYQSLPIYNPVSVIEEFVGHYWAYNNGLNSQYTIPLIYNLDVANPGEVVEFSYQHENIRSNYFSNKRILVEKVTRTYSNDFGAAKKRISWSVKNVTIGIPGEKIPPPSVAEENQAPDVPDVVEEFPDQNIIVEEPQIEVVGVGLQANRIIVLSADSNKVALGTSADGFLDKDMSTFVDISTGLGDKPTMLHVDPYVNSEFLMTAYDGLYMGNPLAFTSWSLIDDPTTIFGAAGICGDLHLSINRQNWAAILSGNAIAFTANFRAGTPSWVVKVPSGGGVSPAASMDGMTIAAFQNLRNGGALGRIWATYGSWPTFTLYKNDLWGLSGSFSVETTFGGTFGSDVVVPYLRENGTPNLPDANEEILFGAGVEGTGQSTIYRGKLSALVDISQPELYRSAFLGNYSRRALVVRDDDPDWVYTGSTASVGGGGYGLYLHTATDGQTFVQSPNPAFTWFSGSFYPAYGITLHPTNRENVLMYLSGQGNAAAPPVWGVNAGGLKGTPDGGENWVDLFDGTNLSTILGGNHVAYAQYI